MVIDWDGKNITGVINPGPDSIRIENATLNPDGWKLHLEASARGVRVVVEGTIEDITSVRRRVVGIWNEGASKGAFRMTRDN